jgi:hypothetical protein
LSLPRERLLRQAIRAWPQESAGPRLIAKQRAIVTTHLELIDRLTPLIRALERRIQTVMRDEARCCASLLELRLRWGSAVNLRVVVDEREIRALLRREPALAATYHSSPSSSGSKPCTPNAVRVSGRLMTSSAIDATSDADGRRDNSSRRGSRSTKLSGFPLLAWHSLS